MEKKITALMLTITVACITSFYLQAQEVTASRTVSGIVTDYPGEPLCGVVVSIKGTSINVISNLDGKYSIDVPENAILGFSYLGYLDQEISVVNHEIINVKLQDFFKIGLQPAQPINLTAKQGEKAQADNSFAFKMFKEVSKQEGYNTFFSPLSLNMVLGMLYNGATGDTRDEIVKVLGMADFSASEINEYYKKISQALLEVDSTTDLSIANSIWYRNSFSVKNRFVEIGNDFFDAEVQALDFNNPNAANTINNWCADKTNNRIKNLVGGNIPDDMMMYLVNALYFKSQWQRDIKFDKKKTKLDIFTKINKQKKKVNLMEQTSYLPYYADEYLQCVEMDYGNRAFSMVVVLPSDKRNINQLIQYLDNQKWENALKNMRNRKVWLKLPRFKIECDFFLDDPIRKTGLEKIYSGGFTNISDDNLFVSNIKQKTFVEVNEEGTEAAAATTIVIVGAGRRAAKVDPVRFFANRPFLYLIREKSTGVVLFIGRMDEPCEY